MQEGSPVRAGDGTHFLVGPFREYLLQTDLPILAQGSPMPRIPSAFLSWTESSSREFPYAPEDSSLFTARPQCGSRESDRLGLKYWSCDLPAGDTGRVT